MGWDGRGWKKDQNQDEESGEKEREGNLMLEQMTQG